MEENINVSVLSGVSEFHTVPEGTVISIIQVFSFLTFVVSYGISHTFTTQAGRKTRLIGTWYTTLLEELSNS